MILMSDALWHGIIGGLSIAMMYLVYYCYKGIRYLIKNPGTMSHAFDSFKYRISMLKEKRVKEPHKLDDEIVVKEQSYIPKSSSGLSFPKWVKKLFVGLLALALLTGICYGTYRLFDDLIIPKRNAHKDLRLIELAQNNPQLADSIACILHGTNHYCDNNRHRAYGDWHEEQARELLHIGARAGSIAAQLHLGKGYESFWRSDWQAPSMPLYHNKSYDKKSGGEFEALQHAVYWFKEASDAGNMEARGRLGVCYYLGNGCERLPLAGERLIKEAADSGLSQFQYIYGNLLERGLTGVYVQGDQEQFFRTEPRIDLAKKYWEMAAEQGNKKAQLKLEKVY